nr:immunoglobulin heavy chain junction region [Macaca mulatta]MOW23182.1 immunoglobulin heavy chain junction region [Macaca mulatta]MOW23707.1 immunoglobulin heavy chain junction region [Macaca mulatta]MOW25607.1 immunoglobulin heavy chain junction region [Macaca mulatta]MOW25658.1 immunoglobulin heavy chain junction region [Macaca mulatta]
CARWNHGSLDIW